MPSFLQRGMNTFNLNIDRMSCRIPVETLMSLPFEDDSYEGGDPSKEIFIKSFTDNNETIYIKSSVVC